MKNLKFIVFLFLLVFAPVVYADSFSSVNIAYDYDRGEETGIWSGYSTTLSHNFGTTDPTIGYINTLNIQTTVSNGYQNGNYYSVTFNFQNDYTGYSSNFTLYNALQEMGHFNLRCATASTGNFLPYESCFTASSFRFERTANNTVRGIITFTPLVNFQRLLINITKDGTPEGQQLVSNYFALSNFSYSISTGGTGEIIDNQNQNTESLIINQNEIADDIINNQNENTEDIINSINENFNGCFNYSNIYSKTRNPYNDNVGYLSSSGSVVNSPMFRYTYFLIVSEDKTYFINRTNNNIAQSYCLYDSNKTLISCTEMGTSLSTNFVPSQDGYVRISYSIASGDSLEFSGQYCTSKFNQLNEDYLSSANSINDSINDNLNSCEEVYPEHVSTIHSKYLYCNNENCNFQGQGSRYVYIFEMPQDGTYKINFLSGTNLRICTSDTLYGQDVALGGSPLTTVINNSSPVLNSSYTFTSNKKYIYVYAASSDGIPIQFIANNNIRCKNKIDDVSDNINKVNDTLTDDNVDSNTGTGFFNDFSSEDFGLSQIITIPLNTIQSLTSKTCIPLDIPIPFTNSSVSLPCMTEIYQTKFTSIYNLWKIVSFGIVGYLICIDIFHMVKGFKDPESDKVEVLDL